MSYQYQTWTFSNDTQPKYVINREQRCYNVFQPPHVVSWIAAKLCHLRHYRGLCPSSCDPSAAGETLQQACHQAHWHQSVLHVAVWHNTAGVALWPGGKSSSIAVAALALITHTPAHYSSPWGDADRGTRASIWSTSAHSVEVAIHGLFTDGLLKKPLVEQCGMLRQ